LPVYLFFATGFLFSTTDFASGILCDYGYYEITTIDLEEMPVKGNDIDRNVVILWIKDVDYLY